MGTQQRLTLVIAIIASFVAFLDGSVVTVALPAISAEVGGGLTTQQWVVDAYLITLGALILLAGSLSDLLGRIRIIRIGLIGFAVASLLCAVAPTDLFLIIARGLQGVAGALHVPSSLALIMSQFSGKAQAKAIGTWTAWTSAAFIVGPLIGGLLVDLGSWRLVFAINVIPIAVTLWLLARVSVPDEKSAHARLDWVGAILATVGIGAPVFSLIEQHNYGWDSPLIYLPLIIGIASFIAFLAWQARAPHPMMPLGLFRVRNFAWGNLATLAIYAALSTSGFLITVYLQQSAGFSATLAGLAPLPITIILMLLSSLFGGLAGRFGPRIFMTAGPIIGGIGHLMMLSVAADFNYWFQLLPGILIFGLGLSITVAPLTSAILGSIASSQAGIGSAINNAVSRVAGLIAIAVLGIIMAANLDLDGLHRGLWFTAGLLVVGGIISWLGIRNPVTESETVESSQ